MKALATCLLLIYVSVSCRPVLPVLADGLAHLLWYQQHVETVHLHDGYAHVHQEIADAAAEDSGEQGTVPSPAKSFKIGDFMAAHVVAEIPSFNISFSDIQSAVLPGSARVLVDLYSKKVPVPPPNLTGPLPQGLPSQKPLLPSQKPLLASPPTTYFNQLLSHNHVELLLAGTPTTATNQILNPRHLLFKEIEWEVGAAPLRSRLLRLASSTSYTFFFFTYHFTVTV